MINFKILTDKDIMECTVRSLVMGALSGVVVSIIGTVATIVSERMM